MLILLQHFLKEHEAATAHKNLYNAPEDKTKYASVYDKYKLFHLK